jgi:ANTAR domain
MSAPPPLASPGPWRRARLAELRPGLADLVLWVAGTSVTERDTEALLREVCLRLTELCALTGCASVLFDGSTGAVRTVVASHPEAEQLTRLIQQLGLGISVAAIQAGEYGVVEDLTESVRAGLAEAALRVGLPVTAGLALRGGDEVVGCLQLFSRTLDTLTTGLLDELAPLATVLGAVLGNLEAYHHSASLVATLSTALDRQGPIEQAKGMLAERHGVDLDAAYRMLRDLAYQRSTTVAEVAAELVHQYWRATREPEDGPGPDDHPGPDDRPEPEARPAPDDLPEPDARADAPAAEPTGQAALLEVPAAPGRTSTRPPVKRTPNAEQPPVPEQTSLLDLAAVPEQAVKPDRNGVEPRPAPADQTPLPEQRGVPADTEPRPTA